MDNEMHVSTEEKLQIANRVSIIGIVVNILLTVFKLIAGIVGRSGAMVSDAIHSSSDVLATLVVMVGINLSGKDSDAEHPYGHDRIESVAAIILAGILFFTGAMIGYNAINQLISGEAIETPGMLAVVAAIVSIVVKEAMYWYTRAAAKKIDSAAMKGDAWHHRSDALSSVGSLIGIVGARLGFAFMDPLAAGIISLLIIKVAFDVAKESIDNILDTSAPDEIEEKLRKAVMEYPKVKGVDDLKTRRFGNGYYLDLEIAMDGDLTLRESHEAAEAVHAGLERRFPKIKHCMIHVNPEGEGKTE
ncbi:MAG: cation transporter [Eubacteriaceae bacterium]|nr:cation transporter [Eubacteriaceae bacterium]